MKLYFCKYLPIKGEEIKIKDVVYSLGMIVGTVTRITKDELEIENETSISIYSPIQLNLNIYKAKLFLCSRDIQVGDKVTYQMEGFQLSEGKLTSIDNEEGVRAYIVSSSESTYVFYPDNPEVNDISEHPFKVIGEISPEAVWMKEGDELDEEDIKKVCHVGWGGWAFIDHSIQKYLKENPNYAEGYIIKCPCCKTFK